MLSRKSLEFKNATEYDTVNELICTDYERNTQMNGQEPPLSTMNQGFYQARDRGSLEFLQDWNKQDVIQRQKMKQIQKFRNQVKASAKQKDVQHDHLVLFLLLITLECTCFITYASI